MCMTAVHVCVCHVTGVVQIPHSPRAVLLPPVVSQAHPQGSIAALQFLLYLFFPLAGKRVSLFRHFLWCGISLTPLSSSPRIRPPSRPRMETEMLFRHTAHDFGCSLDIRMGEPSRARASASCRCLGSSKGLFMQMHVSRAEPEEDDSKAFLAHSDRSEKRF